MIKISLSRIHWGWFISICLLLFPTIGCVAMNNLVDHSVEITRVGDEKIIDVTYSYGVIGPRHGAHLGLGGDGVTAPMPIPEYIDIVWTTENDHKVHEAHVLFKSKVSEHEIRGNIVRIEIEGAVLRIFIVKRLPNFTREAKQIYPSN